MLGSAATMSLSPWRPIRMPLGPTRRDGPSGSTSTHRTPDMSRAYASARGLDIGLMSAFAWGRRNKDTRRRRPSLGRTADEELTHRSVRTVLLHEDRHRDRVRARGGLLEL